MESDISVKKLPHHDQMEFCLNRAKYRQGRKLTAVKVYTVNDESKYIIISGVPAVNIARELDILCQKYGQIDFMKLLADYPHGEFSEVYLVKYQAIKSARFAKKQLDGKSFYGGVFHVCYAPELESVEETREKLQDRRKIIAALTRYKQDPSVINPAKKKVSPNVGKLLSQLRPELQELQNSKRTNVPIGPVNDNANSKQAKSSESESNYEEFGSLIPADAYKIPDELGLFAVNESVQKPAKFGITADKCDTLPSTSVKCLDNEKLPLVNRSVKRPNEFPLNSAKKKIKIFGNKSILSYKQSGVNGGTG